MNMAWKTDPRLRGMDPKKLELLSLFSEDKKKTPPAQMLSALMTLNKRASASGLSFSDRETALIISILTEGMPPAEQKKLQMLKFLAAQLSKGKK